MGAASDLQQGRSHSLPLTIAVAAHDEAKTSAMLTR